jgi:hypothetical protein
MRRIAGVISLLSLLNAVIPSALAQLRNISLYQRDRINIEKTYFILRDTGAAEFGWASEWTDTTANANIEKSAILLWHFKDGSKAYSLQIDDIGEIGKSTHYLLEEKSANLEDSRRKKIQPLTLANPPVKVELWIGKIDESSGYSLELSGDAVCFDAPKIEYNHSYRFSRCE